MSTEITAEVRAECGCFACIGDKPAYEGAWLTVGMSRMIVCANCGNKRCPHGTDHRHACTGSNEPGQPGSRYGAALRAALAGPSPTDEPRKRWLSDREYVIDNAADVPGQGEVEEPAWVERWRGKTIAEAIFEYGAIRGDLSEQYARDQLVAILTFMMAEQIAAAEQRGREDSADHGMCYVAGSEALAARERHAYADGYEFALTHIDDEPVQADLARLNPDALADQKRQAGAAVLREAPCCEEAALLRAFWDLFWNGPGSADYGDHSGYTHAEMVALDDAAALVEDHFVEHGCRLPPRDRAERLEAGE